jgi:hypothetical protein
VLRSLVLALLLFPLGAGSQVFPHDPASGKIFYAEEVLVKDGPKTDLYHRARSWWMTTNKGKQALLLDDATNGVLSGRNYSLLLIKQGNKHLRYKLWHTLQIEVEDDRYWYRISDFQVQKIGAPPTVSRQAPASKQPLEALVPSSTELNKKGRQDPVQQALIQKAQASIAALIQDLKANML